MTIEEAAKKLGKLGGKATKEKHGVTHFKKANKKSIEARSIPDDVTEFLKESNAIEGVYDRQSLRDAIRAWKYISKQEELTEAVVLETHKILMKNQPLKENEKGQFRQVDVRVGLRVCIDWQYVPYATRSWITLTSTHKTEYKIKESHIAYEKIHPFVDGNGRTGRIFMNWQRQKVELPILVIKESEKEEYYSWFME